jgi:hypothetical protein
MTARTIAADPRTEAQKKTDEALASGDWSGLETEELLSEEGVLAILAHAKKLGPRSGVLDQPFRWKSKVYRILKCDFANGVSVVEVAPHDAELLAELKNRVESDRFHHLAYCQGFGFACFPEDYRKYQD